MDTRFGSFVEVKISVRFNQQFCLWLMSRFDHRSRCITLSSGVNLRLFPEDVTKVFGIPHRGFVPWHYSLYSLLRVLTRLRGRLVYWTAMGLAVQPQKHTCVKALVVVTAETMMLSRLLSSSMLWVS